MAHSLPAQARSVYRSILRELPRHPVSPPPSSSSSSSSSSLLSTPSPLQTRIREYISNPRRSTAAVGKPTTRTGAASSQTQQRPAATEAEQEQEQEQEPETTTAAQRARLEEARQFTEYARAQGMYMELLERYNPGAEMDEQERVRLTARRVGMDLPLEMEEEGENENGNGSGGGCGEGNAAR